jgi:hypothetical protein
MIFEQTGKTSELNKANLFDKQKINSLINRLLIIDFVLILSSILMQINVCLKYLL